MRSFKKHIKAEQIDENTFKGNGKTAKVYKSGNYHLVDVKSSKLDTTDWGPNDRGYKSKEHAIAAAKRHVGMKEEVELEESMELDEVSFTIPKSKAAKDYMDKKVQRRDDMNKKNDPGAAKKHLALSVLDKDKARAKAKKKGVKPSEFEYAVGHKPNKMTLMQKGLDPKKARSGKKLPEQYELEEAKERYYAKDAKEMKLKGLALELASKIIKADGSINSYGVERIRKADNVTLRKAIAWLDRVSKTKFTGQDFAHLMDMLPESVEQVEENWATKAMAGKSPLKKKYQAPKDGEEDRAKRMKKKMYGSMMGGLKKEEVEQIDETTQSALKRPVTMTGPDGKTRTVMKTAKPKNTDDHGQDKIRTNESLSESEINDITAQYINENSITLDELENMTEEELNELIGKAIGGAFKLGAKAAVGTARLAGKAAKRAVMTKQGSIRGTKAAKQDREGDKAEKEAKRAEKERAQRDRIKAARDKVSKARSDLNKAQAKPQAS